MLISTTETRSTLRSTLKKPKLLPLEDTPSKTTEICKIQSIKVNSDNIQPKEEDFQQKSEEMPISSPGTRSTLRQLPLEDTEDTVQIYLTTDEEDTLDQDLDKFITNYLETNIIETRTVTLNNEWRITDSIGTPDFPQLLKEDSNFDLLTFITEKMPF